MIDVDLDYNDVTQTIEALAYSSFLRINKRYTILLRTFCFVRLFAHYERVLVKKKKKKKNREGNREGDQAIDYSLFSPDYDSFYYFGHHMADRSSAENEKESGEDDNSQHLHRHHLHRHHLHGADDDSDSTDEDEVGSEEDEAELDVRRRQEQATASPVEVTSDNDAAGNGKQQPQQLARNGFGGHHQSGLGGAIDGNSEVASGVEQQERSLFAGDEWTIADTDDDDEDMTERSYLMIIEEQRRALELVMHELAELKGLRDVGSWSTGNTEISAPTPSHVVDLTNCQEDSVFATRNDDYSILMRENERLRRGSCQVYF